MPVSVSHESGEANAAPQDFPVSADTPGTTPPGHESWLKWVLDNSRDVLYRVNVQTGRHEYISPSVRSVVGYTSEELAALTASDTRAMVHPDDLAAVQRAFTELERTGKAEAEYRQQAKGGGYRWLSNHMRLTRDQAGRPLYRDGSIRDITDRKQAEDSIHLSEEKFALAFANNPAAIALTRLEDGMFIDVNDTWVTMMGYSRAEVIGDSAKKLPIWPTPEERAAFVRELLLKGHLRSWEQKFFHKSGRPFIVELAAQVLTVHGEKVVLSTLIDITDRKRAEQQLRLQSVAMQAAANAIVITGRDGTIEWVNEAFTRLTGYSAGGSDRAEPADA